MEKYIALPLADYQEIENRLESYLGGLPEEEAMRTIAGALALLKKNNSDAASSVRPVRQSFSSVLEEVREQIEYDCFCYGDRSDKQRYNEICLIIAEVMALETVEANGEPRRVKINGSPMLVEMVQDIYRQLTHSHVELVADNFNQITSKIYNKKAYLQTALYNSVFELDAHYSNQVKHDFGW